MAGLLERCPQPDGRETLRVTDSGVREIAATLQRNRAARDQHEELVGRVAREMQRAGRVVWRGLSLRARVGESEEPGADEADDDAPVDALLPGAAAERSGRWVIAMPDVYSIRHTTVEDYVEPVVHEIKVRRADLLSDLRKPDKGAAYRWMGGQCWYVIRAGIAQPEEIPPQYGVMLAQADGTLDVARPAPKRAMRLPFAIWMVLARATPEPLDDDAQAPLA